MTSPRHFRIFISSPGDVSEERRRALAVLDRLPKQPAFVGKITIEAVAWDDPEAPAPLLASEPPQRGVNEYKVRPGSCDLTIVILWSRVGTPLDPGERRPDGQTYASGTEQEFDDAIRAKRDVLVY